MMRMLGFSFVLLLCAGFAAYMGAVQLERSRQREKCSIEAFTERRNGISCLCLSVLLVVLGVGLSL